MNPLAGRVLTVEKGVVEGNRGRNRSRLLGGWSCWIQAIPALVALENPCPLLCLSVCLLCVCERVLVCVLNSERQRVKIKNRGIFFGGK